MPTTHSKRADPVTTQQAAPTQSSWSLRLLYQTRPLHWKLPSTRKTTKTYGIESHTGMDWRRPTRGRQTASGGRNRSGNTAETAWARAPPRQVDNPQPCDPPTASRTESGCSTDFCAADGPTGRLGGQTDFGRTDLGRATRTSGTATRTVH